jgi:PhzF family phenazine biosynthesis protein
VFSRTAFHGNGLVVVLDADGLATDRLQQLTREVRQFETAFVSDLRLESRTARLRVFTEDEELEFAGHPVLGSAAVLHTLSGLTGQVAWTVALGGRLLTVLTRGRDGWVDASMDQGPARLGPIATGDLAIRCREALGLPAGPDLDGLPMQVVSTGLPYLIVPVRAEGLAAAAIRVPDFDALLAECGAKFVYVLDPTTLEGRTWDNSGRVEDVATGSAAGPAAAYLIQHSIRPHHSALRIAQGRFTGRPSSIEVRHEPADGHFWVGGPVAPVAAGHFHARMSPSSHSADPMNPAHSS